MQASPAALAAATAGASFGLWPLFWVFLKIGAAALLGWLARTAGG